MKFSSGNLMRGVLPFLIVFITWGLDNTEATIRQNFWLSNPVLYWWLTLVVRMIFCGVLVVGIWIYAHKKNMVRFIDLIWVVLGIIVVCLSSPLAPFLRVSLQLNPVKFPEPTDLLFIAGACVLVGGIVQFFQKETT